MSAKKSPQKRTYILSNNSDLELMREHNIWDFSDVKLTPDDLTTIAMLLPKSCVTTLKLNNCGITDISVLKGCIDNIVYLSMYSNEISDLSPLIGCIPNVTTLYIHMNGISVEQKSKFRNMYGGFQGQINPNLWL